MSIVFSRVLSISTGFLRFNLGSLPVVLAAVLFGPGAGFAVGALADAIGGGAGRLCHQPPSSPWAPGRWASCRMGAGGICPPAARTSAWPAASCWATWVGSMVLNSLALRLFYGYAWAVLAARIPNALILAGAEFVLVRILLENHALMAAARGSHTGRRSQ